MGVMGTWCQICGLPVQHDHYVPQDGMFAIWRGPATTWCASAVAFGPEHDWLLDAVGLRWSRDGDPAVVAGRVEDGVIVGPGGEDLPDGFVGDGLDERAALHRVCWELAGQPSSWEELDPPSLAELQPYHGQLFAFAELVADGRGWMLVDPRWDSAAGRRSRDRVLALLNAC
jgi:hypothetical protein